MQEFATRSAFCEWFGIPPKPASVLEKLFVAGGAPIRSTQLAEIARISTGCLRVYVHDLRQVLEVEALDHDPRSGYRLTEGGITECRGALVEMARVRSAEVMQLQAAA